MANEYVLALDENIDDVQNVKMMFIKATKMSTMTFYTLEKIGRKEWDYRTIYESKRLSYYLRQMDISTQKMILDKHIIEIYDVVKNDIKMIDISKLSKLELEMLFDIVNHKIRDISGQKKYFADKQSIEIKNVKYKRNFKYYAITQNNQIYIKSKRNFSRLELENMLKQLMGAKSINYIK
jgi:hypothetical protein